MKPKKPYIIAIIVILILILGAIIFAIYYKIKEDEYKSGANWNKQYQNAQEYVSREAARMQAEEARKQN